MARVVSATKNTRLNKRPIYASHMLSRQSTLAREIPKAWGA